MKDLSIYLIMEYFCKVMKTGILGLEHSVICLFLKFFFSEPSGPYVPPRSVLYTLATKAAQCDCLSCGFKCTAPVM